MNEESKTLNNNRNNESISKQKLKENNNFLNSPEISIPILIISVCVITFLIFYVIRWIRIRRQKRLQLEALTSKPSNSQLYAGVRATQTIEFVVPTITLKTTEPYFSFTEESDSDLTQFGYSSDYSNRSRKRNSRIQINESEISKSLYENPPPKPDRRTEINFVLHYSFMRQQLLVTILSAQNLPQKRNNLNPSAKVVLLPEKNIKFITKVQKNTSNPIFNELFIFQAMRDSLDDRILKITVYNSDSFSRKTVIGRAMFPLNTADITSQVTKDIMTDDISCLLSSSQPSGELLISLNYDTISSTMTLGALKVRNIFDREVQQIYMKVVLFVKRKRIRSRKSTLRKVESEIDFNDTFHVNVDKEGIRDLTLSVSIYGKSTAFTNKHILGRTHVGQTCPSPQGRQHWQEMLDNFDTTVSQWHIFS